jgi:hypothetical protein
MDMPRKAKSTLYTQFGALDLPKGPPAGDSAMYVVDRPMTPEATTLESSVQQPVDPTTTFFADLRFPV